MRKKVDFAFIVHSRDRTDLPRKFPLLRLLPQRIFDLLTLLWPPIIVSRITGLTTVDGRQAIGIVIGIPMTAKQLLEGRERAVKKIVQSVKLAQSRGALFVGLGAMTASLSRGGKDVIENVKDIYITTGRTYTIKNITDYVEYCLHKFMLSKDEVSVAIVGASGGIGSGVAISLARLGIKHFTLIDLERKLIHLKKHIEVLEEHSSDLFVNISHKVSSISSCQIVIAATNAPEVVIKSEDVNPGTIIINDAQPSDVSPEILKTRKDVLVIEGGVLCAHNIDCHFDFGLVEKGNIFSCLAETLWLTYRDIRSHHSMEGFNAELYSTIKSDDEKLGFHISDPQNSNGYISKMYIQEFSEIIKDRVVSQSWTS